MYPELRQQTDHDHGHELSSIRIPLLYHSLRSALAVLFSLTGSSYFSRREKQHEAHEFLMNFQTRNVRRRLESMAQRQRDNPSTSTDHRPFPAVRDEESSSFRGSTWMASLAVLILLEQHDFSEALFAAQTLLHRLQRVKILEAVDLELEDLHMMRQQTPELILQYYKESLGVWLSRSPNESLKHVLSTIFTNYSGPTMPVDSNLTPSQQRNTYEERFKCELTIMTLTSILVVYKTAPSINSSQQTSQQQQQPSYRPLWTTLTSALAVTIARRNHASTPTPTLPNDSSKAPSVVMTMVETLQQTLSLLNESSSSDDHHRDSIIIFCLSVIPDALLSGAVSGGTSSHGSLSMDPKHYTAMVHQLKTIGVEQVAQMVIGPLVTTSQEHDEAGKILSALQVLCAWAQYCTLPMETLQVTVPKIQTIFVAATTGTLSSPTALSMAMQLWMLFMEGASLTLEQILASSLMQSKPSQRANKKKQSNKSKKRQQEALQERSTEQHLVTAQRELEHRQQVAFQVARETIHQILPLVRQELQSVQQVDDEVAGEGPVGVMVACANACLPILLMQPNEQQPLCLDFFSGISSCIQEMCQSPSRMVRSFAAETLYTLHEALSKTLGTPSSINASLGDALMNHFSNCNLSLAMGCRYPDGYFSNLAENNDEELENERNDVRDVLRTTTTYPESLEATTAILQQLVQACAEPVVIPSQTWLEERASDPDSMLFPEMALHAFSTLARPLSSLASEYQRNPQASQEEVLSTSMNIIYSAGMRLERIVTQLELPASLPLCRLYNLATASWTPLLSTLLECPKFQPTIFQVCRVAVSVACLSLMYIPELVGPSTLRSSRYDIRGAMRTPGGEDHSGVLALMRFASQHPSLAQAILQNQPSIKQELCELHQHLKRQEQERGREVFYGKGVLPKSRRILLGAICHFEEAGRCTNSSGGFSLHIGSILESSIQAIASTSNSAPSLDTLYQVVEHAFDLAAFSPQFLRCVLEDNHSTTNVCLEVLQQLLIRGYSTPMDTETLREWNRLRAACFCLYQAAGSPDLPRVARKCITQWVQVECDAITKQCHAGPQSPTLIFREELMSEEEIPAGLALFAVHKTVQRALSLRGHLPLDGMSNCLGILVDCQAAVLAAVSSPCPFPIDKNTFYDPRPMVLEAWLLALLPWMKLFGSSTSDIPKNARMEIFHCVSSLTSETCVALVRLLFYPSLGKTQEARANDPGTTTDGAHMLVAMEFMEFFFRLGPAMVQATSQQITEYFPFQSHLAPSSDTGLCIIVAALFRTCSGGLPPWSVECMPNLFEALFQCSLEHDTNRMDFILQASMIIRGTGTNRQLLAGRFIDALNAKAKSTFHEAVMEIVRTNSNWKSLKSLIKQACGGKKKETDFRQRPGLTKLDAMDRM